MTSKAIIYKVPERKDAPRTQLRLRGDMKVPLFTLLLSLVMLRGGVYFMTSSMDGEPSRGAVALIVAALIVFVKSLPGLFDRRVKLILDTNGMTTRDGIRHKWCDHSGAQECVVELGDDVLLLTLLLPLREPDHDPDEEIALEDTTVVDLSDLSLSRGKLLQLINGLIKSNRIDRAEILKNPKGYKAG